jgi:hypothetical protein
MSKLKNNQLLTWIMKDCFMTLQIKTCNQAKLCELSMVASIWSQCSRVTTHGYKNKSSYIVRCISWWTQVHVLLDFISFKRWNCSTFTRANYLVSESKIYCWWFSVCICNILLQEKIFVPSYQIQSLVEWVWEGGWSSLDLDLEPSSLCTHTVLAHQSSISEFCFRTYTCSIYSNFCV